MECLHPIIVKSKDGRSNTRLVPCGKCIACRVRRAASWSLRVQNEAAMSKSCFFVTLTYSDDYLVYGDYGKATLVPSDMSAFIKRYRKYLSVHNPSAHVRFFACGEYGDKFSRPHFHFMLFYNVDIEDYQVRNGVQACWHYNDSVLEPVDVQFFSVALSNYVTKYCVKQVGFDYEGVVPPFVRMSRMPGIGANFYTLDVQRRVREAGQHYLYDRQQHKIAIPRYYRPFFYSDDEQLDYSYQVERQLFLTDDLHQIYNGGSYMYYEDKIRSHDMYEYNYFRDFRCHGFKVVRPDVRLSRSFGLRFYNNDIDPDGSF